ncbi:MAG: eukaryotic-like serine/threonine-protein kinase [Actinomycetota bacterium]|nr:eukaryotic-like serine/threonine-protein kinase [Actinomycetota bacterium]
MAVSVVLTVIRGPLDGQEYLATERTTWVLGRSRDCDPRLPDDPDHRTVSRHHCLLDINPPQVRIRDFGSLNGTRINGTVIGRRRTGQTPEDAAADSYPEHDLKDGDELRLGDTVLRIKIRGSEPTMPQEIVPAGVAAAFSVGDPDAAVRSLFGSGGRPGRHALLDPGIDHLVGPPADLMGYEVVREIGRGLLGAVFLARHVRTDHEIALKVMLPQVTAAPEVSARFLREIEATRGLHHDHIAVLGSAGEHDRVFFFASEYCAGGNLEDLLVRNDGSLPVDAAVPIFLQALDGLENAHRFGVVHRNLNPRNIMFTGGDAPVVKLGDFSLAKAFDQAGLSGLTRTGATAGKPYFLPRNQVIDFRRTGADVDTWAMAACLYQALTGTYPRDFTSDRDPWLAILTQDAVPIRRRAPGLPDRLAQVIDHALRETPSIGFASASALRDALASCW